MKHVLLLIPIFMLTACGEEYDVREFAHIVSVDPPVRPFTEEHFDEWYPPPATGYIPVNRYEYTTITVTFSAPPEELSVRDGPYYAHNYLLKDRTLRITAFCFDDQDLNKSSESFSELYIKWRDGGRMITLYCPPEEDE